MSAHGDEIARFAIGKYVILRTYSAGVHCGVLVARSGREAILSDSRRIWNWREAYTLHEIAAVGCGRESKISQSLDESLVTEVIEVIPCTQKAEEVLRGAQWNT